MNLGDACAYRCEFCYVEAAMRKIDKPWIEQHNKKAGLSGDERLDFPDVVIRRRNTLVVPRGLE